MDQIKDHLLLDMYLSPHVNTLYSCIRQRALRQVNIFAFFYPIKFNSVKKYFYQYFSPYKSADLRKMAQSFNTTTNALEVEIFHLILYGKIQPRIDSQNKVDFLSLTSL